MIFYGIEIFGKQRKYSLNICFLKAASNKLALKVEENCGLKIASIFKKPWYLIVNPFKFVLTSKK